MLLSLYAILQMALREKPRKKCVSILSSDMCLSGKKLYYLNKDLSAKCILVFYSYA